MRGSFFSAVRRISKIRISIERPEGRMGRMLLTLSESSEKLNDPAVDGIKALRVELLCSCCALIEQAGGVEPDKRMVS